MAVLSASPLVRTYTLEEFWALPEPADHSKLELIAGVLYIVPPPGEEHDDEASTLLEVLLDHVRTGKLPGRFYFPRAAIGDTPATYLEPDLFYVSFETQARMPKGRRTTADLVVEVISPGSRQYDRSAKADTYGALGVRELWLFDKEERTLEIRYQTGGGFGERRVFTENEEIVSRVFPELRVSVRRLLQ